MRIVATLPRKNRRGPEMRLLFAGYSLRTCLEHQHGRRFIVLEHRTNMADVTSCKKAI